MSASVTKSELEVFVLMRVSNGIHLYMRQKSLLQFKIKCS